MLARHSAPILFMYSLVNGFFLQVDFYLLFFFHRTLPEKEKFLVKAITYEPYLVTS